MKNKLMALLKEQWLSFFFLIIIVLLIVGYSVKSRKINDMMQEEADRTIISARDSIWMLEKEIVVLNAYNEALRGHIDSVLTVINKHDGKLNEINTFYDSIYDNVSSMDIDQLLLFFTDHVSPTDSL